MFYTYDDISRVKYFSSVLYNINNLYKNLYSDDENYVNKKEFDILNRFVRSFYNLILVVEDVVLLDDGSAVKKSDFGDFIASEFQKLDSKILNLNLEKENFQDSSFKFYSVFLDFSNNLINGLKDNKDSNNLRLTLISFKESISTNMNLTFRESISNLSSKNYNINFNRDNTLKSISDNDTLNESQKYLNLLKKEEQSYKERADTIIQNFQKEISQIQANYTESIKNTISELSFEIETANKDFKETYHDYEILKKMVNRSGEQQVTDHYSKRAFWERITYWVMTIITFIIIIISVCLALHGLNEYKAKTDISATMLIEKYKDESIEKIEKIYSVAQENALIYLVLRL
ncbi:hypothetical protein [Acinetobacter bereziniae]|uniref:hypothetical protein n=1 Tax=Acinetobacter bereziniae TaxID=106648 RepID=UPI003AF471F6